MREFEALDRLITTAWADGNDVEIIKQALTPPSEEEVCKALSEWLEVKVEYIKHSKSFYTVEDKQIARYIDKNIGMVIRCNLPPHIITMLGQFYEAQIND